jgi:peptidoglycan/LPS O-acetylase OafA/YrhL
VRRWLLPTPGAHLEQLDSLRAFAVLCVLLTHFAPATRAIAPFADFGVRLFFVLSGFLITGILLRAGRENRPRTLRRFYVRRFLRIFPAFYLVLVVTAALAVPGIREGFWWFAAYLANFWFILVGSVANPNYGTHFWTLAVEEQFYLVAPALILFAPRRYLKPVLIGAAGVAVAYRASAVAAGWSWDAYTRAPTACLDSLGLGALLAVTRLRGLGDRWTRWALVLGLPLLAVDLAANTLAQEDVSTSLLDFQHIFQDTAFALVSVWLVAGASRGFGGLGGRLLSLWPLVYLGTISYGIYLYHFFAIWGFQAAFGWKRGHDPDQAVYFLVLTAATIVVATGSWFAFERPINGLKRYFPYDGDSARSRSIGARVGQVVRSPKLRSPWIPGIGLPFAGIAAFAATAVLVEAFTDRDWSLSGLEWPADFVTAALLVLMVPLALGGLQLLLNFRARRHRPRPAQARVSPASRKTTSRDR